MQLQTNCELKFELPGPTPFVFMLRPRSGAQQWVSSEDYSLSDVLQLSEFTDNFGNLCQRLVAPEGDFSVSTRARVTVPDTIDREPRGQFVKIQNLPDSVLCYLLPSRYCESEHFSQMATEITTGAFWGFDQVAAIEAWVRNNVRYEQGEGDTLVSAREVNVRQWGVCRDLAHLGIALCRSLTIPARLVVGYLHKLHPMDLHAWFEAYVAGRWFTFDPTQTVLRGGYVVLGYGRDAADVAVYNQYGPAVYPTVNRVSVECIDTNMKPFCVSD
jgi:transglutaminase-like putative cysteine protease